MKLMFLILSLVFFVSCTFPYNIDLSGDFDGALAPWMKPASTVSLSSQVVSEGHSIVVSTTDSTVHNEFYIWDFSKNRWKVFSFDSSPATYVQKNQIEVIFSSAEIDAHIGSDSKMYVIVYSCSSRPKNTCSDKKWQLASIHISLTATPPNPVNPSVSGVPTNPVIPSVPRTRTNPSATSTLANQNDPFLNYPNTNCGDAWKCIPSDGSSNGVCSAIADAGDCLLNSACKIEGVLTNNPPCTYEYPFNRKHVIVDLINSNVEFLDVAPADILTNPLYKTDKLVLIEIPKGESIDVSGGSRLIDEGLRGGVRIEDKPIVYKKSYFNETVYVAIFEVTRAQAENIIYSGKPVGLTGALDIFAFAKISDPRSNNSLLSAPFSGTILDTLTYKTGYFFSTIDRNEFNYFNTGGSPALSNTFFYNGKVDDSSLDTIAWYGSNLPESNKINCMSGICMLPYMVGLKMPNSFGLFDMTGNGVTPVFSKREKNLGASLPDDFFGLTGFIEMNRLHTAKIGPGSNKQRNFRQYFFPEFVENRPVLRLADSKGVPVQVTHPTLKSAQTHGPQSALATPAMPISDFGLTGYWPLSYNFFDYSQNKNHGLAFKDLKISSFGGFSATSFESSKYDYYQYSASTHNVLFLDSSENLFGHSNTSIQSSVSGWFYLPSGSTNTRLLTSTFDLDIVNGSLIGRFDHGYKPHEFSGNQLIPLTNQECEFISYGDLRTDPRTLQKSIVNFNLCSYVKGPMGIKMNEQCRKTSLAGISKSSAYSLFEKESKIGDRRDLLFKGSEFCINKLDNFYAKWHYIVVNLASGSEGYLLQVYFNGVLVHSDMIKVQEVIRSVMQINPAKDVKFHPAYTYIGDASSIRPFYAPHEDISWDEKYKVTTPSGSYNSGQPTITPRYNSLALPLNRFYHADRYIPDTNKSRDISVRNIMTFNRTLTANEVKQIFDKGLSNTPEGMS